MSNPYAFLKVNPKISGQDLQRNLMEYRAKLMKIYVDYSNAFLILNSIATNLVNNKEAEILLSKRYALGLDLNGTFLSSKELQDYVKNVEDSRKNNSASRQLLRAEMFTASTAELRNTIQKIEMATDLYRRDSNNPKDSSKMLDVLIEIKYKEKMVEIANEIAMQASKNGEVFTEEEFRQVLMNSKEYLNLQAVYGQINEKAKRDMSIPELYVMSQMSDLNQISIIPEKEVENLLKREEKYEIEFLSNQLEKNIDSKEAKRKNAPENQKHDYAWGIVLEKPEKLLKDEPVDSPIFQGKITVEQLGYFTEHSLFRKKQHTNKKKVEVVEKSKIKNLIMKRFKQNKKYRTVKEISYRHESCKHLVDNILRVTKTDLEGRTTSRIIISPVQYIGRKGSKLFDFMKNVYFSDYMLDIARTNGGYAGQVRENDDGFYISNKYNQEEIASAVLFANGQKGVILDNRDKKSSEKYAFSTIDTLKWLVDERRKEKEFI